VYLVWAAVVALAVAASQTSTVADMVTVVLAVDLTLMVVLLGVSLWRLRGTPEVPVGNLAETGSTPWTQ